MSYIPSFKAFSATRKFDVGLLLLSNTGDSSVSQSVSQGGGMAVTGARKLAQRVILRLCSPNNTYQYEPSERSTFATDAINANLTTVSDIRSTLGGTIEQLLQMFDKEAELDATLPADEIPDTLTIENITLNATVANVELRLTTRAGESLTFITPFRLR